MTPFQAASASSQDTSRPAAAAAAITLPYHTTSQQAIDTLSSAIAFPASRSAQHFSYSPSKKKSTRSLKQKKKSRFAFCACGGNAQMYDDDDDEDSKGRSDQVLQAGLATKIELEKMPSHPIEDAGMAAVGEADNSASSTATTQARKEMPPCSPNASVTDDNFSATSISPKAQVLTAVRLEKAQTALPSLLTSENDRNSFAASRLFNSRVTHAIGQDASTSADECSNEVEDSQGTIRPLPPLPMEIEEKEEESSIRQSSNRSRRRGGFISTSSAGIPTIDVENPSIDIRSSDNDGEDQIESMSYNGDSPYVSLASSPARFSVASSASVYSTASPFIQSPYIPHQCPPGRTTMGTTPHPLSSFQQAPSSRSSVATSDQTDSDNDSLSNESSNQSPAMGDVLSHFPNLVGMDTQIKTALLQFTSSPCPSSNFNDDDDLSSRIHTFGPRAYALKNYDLNSNLDSPARTNTFIYDDDDMTFSIEQQQFLTHQSVAPSTCSSPDGTSPARSRKSQKRGAVLCELPSLASSLLSTRDNRDTALGDLTWEENLLEMSRQQSSSQNDVEYQEHYEEQVAPHAAQSEARARSSSNGQAPFSPPPDLPLPPIPQPLQKVSQRKGTHQLRPFNSLVNAPKQQSSSPAQFPLHHSMKASFPRSSTCPDLAALSGGYAF